MNYQQRVYAWSCLAKQRWVYAKSMPTWPHEYITRSNWRAVRCSFNAMVTAIRVHGTQRSWGGRMFRYLDLNGWQFWTMGAPVPETELINRARLTVTTPYDDIADRYDGLFQEPDDLRLDGQVREWLLRHMTGDVLDIGAGTGWLIDKVADATNTICVEPSAPMAERLREKHPTARVYECTAAQYAGPQADTVCALFGVGSYLSEAELQDVYAMRKPNGVCLLMFYGDEYEPVTYARTGIRATRHRHAVTGTKLNGFDCIVARQ